MTNLLHKDANRIACGRCCPPPPSEGMTTHRVRVRRTDDQTLLTERCPDEIRGKLTADDIEANGDRVLPLRPDGRCTYLSADNTCCTLVLGDIDKRPAACTDVCWSTEACAELGCPKLELDG